MKLLVLLVLTALLGTVAAVTSRQGDLPFQTGFCEGNTIDIFKECEGIKDQSTCEGKQRLWSAQCTWLPQPFAAASYQDLSANSKMAKLWAKIAEDTSSGSFPNTLGVVTSVLGENLKTTFELASDQMPQGHTKIIHSVGTHSKFEWKNTGGHEYTGLFASGSKEGVLRFSLAAAPDNKAEYKPPGTQPGTNTVGISVKVLRDGLASANFVAMRPAGAGGQNSFNFFESELQNHVAAPSNPVLQDKFATASSWVNMVGLKDFGEFDASGKKASSPKYPFMLSFRPTAAVKSKFSNTYSGIDSQLETTKLEAGTTVYDIYAQASPKATFQKIGEMKILTKPITSKFGDTTLFFQHRKMEYDMADNGAWLNEASSKPVDSHFFAPIENLDETAGKCPYGHAFTRVQEAERRTAAKDAYIRQLESEVHRLKDGSSGSSIFAPIMLVSLLIAVVAGGIWHVVKRSRQGLEQIPLSGPQMVNA